MDRNKKPRLRDDLEVVNRPDSQALFDPVTGELHALNPTAMAIWQACDGTTTEHEIARALSELTGLNEERALDEVSEILERFRTLSLVN